MSSSTKGGRKSSKEFPEKNLDQTLLPFQISFNGTIVTIIARILSALCRLIEELIDWVIRKLRKD